MHARASFWTFLARCWPARGERALGVFTLLVVALATLTLSDSATDAARRFFGHWESFRAFNLHLNPFRTRHALYESGLPVYDLRIKPSEYKKILATVEEAERRGLYTDDLKQWARAKFLCGGVRQDVKIRLRGHLSCHWRGPHKSWRIRFKHDEPFQGLREIDLIVLADSKGIQQPFVNAVYAKLGLMTLRDGYAILRINGALQGVYYQIEPVDTGLLAHHRRPDGTVFVNPGQGLELACFKEQITEDNRPAWEALRQLLAYEKDPTPENFRAALAVTDVEDYLRFIAGTTLFCSSHSRFASDNHKLYYDPSRGLFSRIPWDLFALRIPRIHWYDLGNSRATFDLFWWWGPMCEMRLAMVRDQPYRLRRDRILWELVKDDSLIELFDETYRQVKPALWADVMGHGDEDQRLADYRNVILRNTSIIRDALADTRGELTIQRQGPYVSSLEIAVDNASGFVLHGLVLESGEPGVHYQLLRDANADGRLDDGNPVIGKGVADAQGIADVGEFEELLLPDTGVVEDQPLYLSPAEPRDTRMMKPLGTMVYPKTRRYTYFLTRSGDGPFDASSWPRIAVRGVNAVTDKPLHPHGLRTRAHTPVVDFMPARRTTTKAEFLALNRQFAGPAQRMQDNTIVLPAGRHRFVGTTVVPEGVMLEIEAGAELWMAPGASLVCHGPVLAIGCEDAPIRLLPATTEPWGTFAVVRPGTESVFRHVHVSGGNGAAVDGITFTGALAVHDGDVILEACGFVGCPAEDAVNVKNGHARIAGCTFAGNDSDDIDLDFVQGEVVRCQFSDTGGDAIDVSGAEITIAGNRIERAGDKGVSVGEQSDVSVIDNLLIDNLIAIAVKDASRARIEKCTMIGNDMAVAAYRKKPIFGGGHAIVKDCVILDTRKPVIADAHSTIELDSCVLPEDGPAHRGIAATQDLSEKLRSSGFVHNSDNPPAG